MIYDISSIPNAYAIVAEINLDLLNNNYTKGRAIITMKLTSTIVWLFLNRLIEAIGEATARSQRPTCNMQIKTRIMVDW